MKHLKVLIPPMVLKANPLEMKIGWEMILEEDLKALSYRSPNHHYFLMMVREAS